MSQNIWLYVWALNTTPETTLVGVFTSFVACVIEDFIQFICSLQRSELMVPANNIIVYYDDRYRPPPKLFHHSPFHLRVPRNIDFFVVDLLLIKQGLRRTTIRTVSSCVNFNLTQCKAFLLRLLLS